MRTRMIGRLYGVAFLALVALVANVDGARYAYAESPTTAAATQARDTFREFRLSTDLEAKAVRVMTDGQDHWLTPVGTWGARELGRVRSGPKAGTLVVFEAADVTDWVAFDASGRMYGNFGARATLTFLSPRDAALVRAVLSDSPLPPAPES